MNQRTQLTGWKPIYRIGENTCKSCNWKRLISGIWGFPGGVSGKESPCQRGSCKRQGPIPGSGRSSGGGHGNPLQYSCLENPMDRGAWWAILHGVSKSCTQLNRLSTHTQQEYTGNSLVAQWLRIYFPMQGTRIWSLVRELRSHMLWDN